MFPYMVGAIALDRRRKATRKMTVVIGTFLALGVGAGFLIGWVFFG
jgi:hypothetical protein